MYYLLSINKNIKNGTFQQRRQGTSVEGHPGVFLEIYKFDIILNKNYLPMYEIIQCMYRIVGYAQ